LKDRITLRTADLSGYLSKIDRENIMRLHRYYNELTNCFRELSVGEANPSLVKNNTDKIISIYEKMGEFMQKVTAEESNLHVYSFETPSIQHGEVSRLIAKLRNFRTTNEEFVYYIQRAYELLFNLAWGGAGKKQKNHLIVRTPITMPVQNFAVHKIPDVDDLIKETVMCVMLRGALLPSMILSKEIQEYSSTGMVTPFALFRIQRNDSKSKDNMEYVLDLNMSYFDLENLEDKNLVFADPMNATGGSMVTIVKYLRGQGVRPRSIKILNVVAALQGSLQVIRSIENIDVYMLWMDPALNNSAYILPGLGDAGNRINGTDAGFPRSMIQLVADYGSNMASLYRSQVREIERTVLGG